MQNLDFGKQSTNLLARRVDPFLRAPYRTQFGRRDEACADIDDSSAEHVPGDAPVRVFDQFGQDVSVKQQLPAQKTSRGSSGTAVI
jgi:hypothetical protein